MAKAMKKGKAMKKKGKAMKKMPGKAMARTRLIWARRSWLPPTWFQLRVGDVVPLKEKEMKKMMKEMKKEMMKEMKKTKKMMKMKK